MKSTDKGRTGLRRGEEDNRLQATMLVDAVGLIIHAVVHPADDQNRDGAYAVLAGALDGRADRVRYPWVDAGYRRPLLEWIVQFFVWTAEFVIQSAAQVGIPVQPGPWVVERTFAWLGRFRRLSKDHEEDICSAEAWIYVVVTRILVRGLASAGA